MSRHRPSYLPHQNAEFALRLFKNACKNCQNIIRIINQAQFFCHVILTDYLRNCYRDPALGWNSVLLLTWFPSSSAFPLAHIAGSNIFKGYPSIWNKFFIVPRISAHRMKLKVFLTLSFTKNTTYRHQQLYASVRWMTSTTSITTFTVDLSALYPRLSKSPAAHIASARLFLTTFSSTLLAALSMQNSRCVDGSLSLFSDMEKCSPPGKRWMRRALRPIVEYELFYLCRYTVGSWRLVIFHR